MSIDKVFVDDQQTQLDIREVESVGQKLNTLINSSSRIAISLKNNKSNPGKGSLLTNQLIEKNYLYAYKTKYRFGFIFGKRNFKNLCWHTLKLLRNIERLKSTTKCSCLCN